MLVDILLIPFLLTVVIEGITMLLLTRSFKWVCYNLLCNMVTNPVMNILLFLITLRFGTTAVYYLAVVIGELAILFLEAWFYRKMTEASSKKCFLRSLITNALSFSLGLVLVSIF